MQPAAPQRASIESLFLRDGLNADKIQLIGCMMINRYRTPDEGVNSLETLLRGDERERAQKSRPERAGWFDRAGDLPQVWGAGALPGDSYPDDPAAGS